MLTLDVTRIQQLPANFSLFATAQVTNKALLASEEIALGGASFSRGYDDGEVAGDNGWAGSIELRYWMAQSWLPRGIQFYIYYDAGQVWSKGDALFEGSQTLLSAGGGARVNLLDNLYASVEIAKALNRDIQTTDDKTARVFFSLVTHY